MQPMAGRRRLERKTDDRRPVVTDDFIYDDPHQSYNEDSSDTGSSDTPEEAVRKLRSSSGQTDPANDDPVGSSDDIFSGGKGSGPADDSISSSAKPEDAPQAVEKPGKKIRNPHPVLRGAVLILITVFLLGTAGAFIFHRINANTPYLDIPEKLITAAVSPVQSFFSGITETVFGYFRDRRLRSNIEQEYDNLVQQYEQLVYKANQADQRLQELSKYETLSSEVKANQDMQPLDCNVIGKSDSNYFSTLIIDKGKADGITDDMAVTYDYSLIGYTYNTTEHTSTVITIINTDASIQALIQSTRDQGTVYGTLGINGRPQCRMHYTPDESLPRPGDQVVTSGVGKPFPKGILIGTVEESTRGTDSDSQYIVLNPSADFQNLDHVTVLLYRFVSDDESQAVPDTDEGINIISEPETDAYAETEAETESDMYTGTEGVTFGEVYNETDFAPDGESYAEPEDEEYSETEEDDDSLSEDDWYAEPESGADEDTGTEMEYESDNETE